MSYTFANHDKQQYANRIMSAQKHSKISNLRSHSRKARIEIQTATSNKRMKRAETVNIGSPCLPESKIKLRKELNDMATLKYHISQGKMEGKFRVTSTVLGSGSYALVKLGEEVGDSNKKVAVKIYEKNKLYMNKHRRKNLCNEILCLKAVSHKNLVKLIDVFEDRANIYLILEHVEGQSL